MRYYNKQHQYYCGIDLHTKTRYVCILDQAGKIVLHQNIAVDAELLLKLILPYMPDIVIAVECIFTWYWLADFCEKYNLPFVLGHVLDMPVFRREKSHSWQQNQK